ncbi:MAG TPA: DUF1330 domain-containing protein [Thermodesulfobacteriota bacterium]|nr:DUF1330 domain-containing protein [Thermodesulfobacteriota bacterium]
MPAYAIAMMSIHDPETYRKYTALTPGLVKKHGGRFLTRGEKVTTVEGEEFADRMVILEFPTEEHARVFFSDPEYAKARVFRHQAARSRILLQQGGANTENPDPKL